jgi:AcrR family transcriptional regulator
MTLTPRLTRHPASRAAPPPGRRRDAGRTRERLLAAGAALFAERGYDGVPLWLIAERAGVNKAMVSYHFGGKHRLYLTIVSDTFAEIAGGVERLAAGGRPAPELLRELVALVADLVTRRHPHFPAMMLREMLSGGRHLEAEALARPLDVLAAVRQIVERGVREGTLRPVEPLLTHLTLVGSLVFFLATAPFRERVLADGRPRMAAPDAAAYVAHLQDFITRALVAPGACEAARGAGRPAARARANGSART